MKYTQVAITVFLNDDGERLGQFLVSGDKPPLAGQRFQFVEMQVVGLANFSKDCSEHAAYEAMTKFVQGVLHSIPVRLGGMRGNPEHMLEDIDRAYDGLSVFEIKYEDRIAGAFVIRDELKR